RFEAGVADADGLGVGEGGAFGVLMLILVLVLVREVGLVVFVEGGKRVRGSEVWDVVLKTEGEGDDGGGG
ncbi:MAG: hypothetical protein Q9183_005317, partial [Haloplaca sp. 2 TL-2023]